MKRNIVLLTLFIAFATAITGQNAHWEYQFSSSGNPVAPTSAVIVNSFGKIYLFQTDPVGIYVSIIDHSTMQPVAIDYELPSQGYDFLLEGGYGDFNGNIVVYGSVDLGNGPIPISGIYDVTSHTFTSYFLDSAHPDDYFINGCCGYDVNGNKVNMLVLENAGQLVCVDWDHNSIDSLKITTLNGKISDVVWDTSHQRFAAAGYQESGLQQIFLLEVRYDVNSGFIVQNTLAWNLAGPSYSQGEYRTCLEVISDSEIIVGHCARTQQTDGVWLSVVNSYTTVTNSVFFDMPSQKLLLLDMKFDDTRNQLALLFEMLHSCGRVNIIAQVDPYSLSGMSAAEVWDTVAPSIPCAYSQDPLYDNEIYLKKLELNRMPWSCARILASGIIYNGFFGQDVFVTETYKIAHSQCDYVFFPGETGASYAYNTVSWLNSYHYYVYPPVFSPFPNPGSLSENWSCPDIMPCSKGIVESPKRMTNEGHNVAKLEFEIDGTLVFQSFSGEIFYGVYNALGQLVLSGHTHNGIFRLDLPDTGFYIIKAEDNSGNVVTKKIICTR